jgi:hypothetical protein
MMDGAVGGITIAATAIKGRLNLGVRVNANYLGIFGLKLGLCRPLQSGRMRILEYTSNDT